MKRYLLLCSFFGLCATSVVSAQVNHNNQLHFYYISHDRNADVQKLSRVLHDAFDNLKEYNDCGIFYLANGESPFIVKVNLPDENEADFGTIISELQEKVSHFVNPSYDVNRLLELWQETPFLSDTGNLVYSSFEWNYYVSSFFWSMGYNESIIGTLYWTFDMDRLLEDPEFSLFVLRAPDDHISFPEGQALGNKNYCDVNQALAIISY